MFMEAGTPACMVHKDYACTLMMSYLYVGGGRLGGILASGKSRGVPRTPLPPKMSRMRALETWQVNDSYPQVDL